MFLADGFPMDLMAVITSDGTQFMNRSPELREVFLFVMALEAGLGPFLGRLPFERKDHALTLCLCMFGPRAMAGLTSLLSR